MLQGELSIHLVLTHVKIAALDLWSDWLVETRSYLHTCVIQTDLFSAKCTWSAQSRPAIVSVWLDAFVGNITSPLLQQHRKERGLGFHKVLLLRSGIQHVCSSACLDCILKIFKELVGINSYLQLEICCSKRRSWHTSDRKLPDTLTVVYRNRHSDCVHCHAYNLGKWSAYVY